MAAPRNDNMIKNLFWLFFGFRGRISREVFWLANAFFFVIIFALLFPHFVNFTHLLNENPGLTDQTITLFASEISNDPVLSWTLLLTRYCLIVLYVKRAHDCGLPGYIALLSLIPMLDIGLLFFLGFLWANPAPNKYGNRTNQRP